MGVRKNIQIKFEEIEQNHGRITKSIFVISHWIMESKRFEHMSRKSKNIDTLSYVLKHRDAAIEEMLKTNLFNIRIYKPNENENSWIYMLHIEREGMEVNLTAPYLRHKDTVNIKHSELEKVGYIKDSLYLGKIRCYYGERFKLGFIVENIEKSRKKLIEKMNEEL